MRKIIRFGILFIGACLIAQAQAPRHFANELPEYRFADTANWSLLIPDVSTMDDVRRLMGDPDDATDMSQYGKPYPGDSSAKQPLFTYRKSMPGWEILVYFSSYCFRLHEKDTKQNHVCSIDLIPNKPISFKDVIFPALFVKRYEPGVEAPFFQFTDADGLQYETYVAIAANGERIPGNLNRISYGLPTPRPDVNPSPTH